MLAGILDSLQQRLSRFDAALARTALDQFESRENHKARPSRTVPVSLEELQTALKPEGRPVVEHHWASWCTGCLEELPLVRQLAADLGDSADVVTVSWDRFQDDRELQATLDDVARHMQGEPSVPSLVFTGESDALFAALNLTSHQVPQTRVLDADGGVLRVFHGPLDADDVRVLEGLLKTR